MAKVEGTQSVPAPLLDSYRATLGEQRPNDRIQKRYPYRVKKMQEGGSGVSRTQIIQRNRFKTVRDQFNTLSPAERARWYAGMPPWSSLLWYYNFFMLSGLMDILGADARGASVIKSIQNIKDTIPTGGKTVTIPNAIVVAKTVIMLWGASYNEAEKSWPAGAIGCWESGQCNLDWTNYAYRAWNVYPVWDNLQVTSIDISWGTTPKVAGDVSLQVIEYL